MRRITHGTEETVREDNRQDVAFFFFLREGRCLQMYMKLSTSHMPFLGKLNSLGDFSSRKLPENQERAADFLSLRLNSRAF
jgi:hypothetical protein